MIVVLKIILGSVRCDYDAFDSDGQYSHCFIIRVIVMVVSVVVDRVPIMVIRMAAIWSLLCFYFFLVVSLVLLLKSLLRLV